MPGSLGVGRLITAVEKPPVLMRNRLSLERFKRQALPSDLLAFPPQVFALAAAEAIKKIDTTATAIKIKPFRLIFPPFNIVGLLKIHPTVRL